MLINETLACGQPCVNMLSISCVSKDENNRTLRSACSGRGCKTEERTVPLHRDQLAIFELLFDMRIKFLKLILTVFSRQFVPTLDIEEYHTNVSVGKHHKRIMDLTDR